MYLDDKVHMSRLIQKLTAIAFLSLSLLVLCAQIRNPEDVFRDKVKEEGNGWLTKHFGEDIPEVSRAHGLVTSHQHSIQLKKEQLKKTLEELSEDKARQLITEKIQNLTKQEEKLIDITERLEEITYTYILMHSAYLLLPEQTDEADMKALISDINLELRSAEEIEKGINTSITE